MDAPLRQTRRRVRAVYRGRRENPAKHSSAAHLAGSSYPQQWGRGTRRDHVVALPAERWVRAPSPPQLALPAPGATYARHPNSRGYTATRSPSHGQPPKVSPAGEGPRRSAGHRFRARNNRSPRRYAPRGASLVAGAAGNTRCIGRAASRIGLAQRARCMGSVAENKDTPARGHALNIRSLVAVAVAGAGDIA